MTTLELYGIKHELSFWQQFVKTERFLRGWVQDHKTPELNNFVHNFILEKFYSGFKVLDVGSGVVSILNGTIPKSHITACDPLGGLYELVFDYKRYGIKPPLPIPAEEMTFDSEFDIVHASNALDHCQDPITAYYRLLLACNDKGYLIIQGFENEAEYENYSGFHQWNIRLTETKELVISNKDGIVEIFNNPFYAERIKLDTGKDWFIWIVQA